MRGRSNRAFPRNKTELVNCLRRGACSSTKLTAVTHVEVGGEFHRSCT